MHPRLAQLALLLALLFAPAALAASRASFCKCTCGRNGTIIPLDRPASSGAAAADDDDDERPRARSCGDCNRQFCLEYDLPHLADCRAENRGREEDIIATCFQRDSAKDQAVVYSFIALTVGLLGYAAVRPYIEKRRDAGSSQNHDYAPLPPGQNTLG